MEDAKYQWFGNTENSVTLSIIMTFVVSLPVRTVYSCFLGHFSEYCAMVMTLHVVVSTVVMY